MFVSVREACARGPKLQNHCRCRNHHQHRHHQSERTNTHNDIRAKGHSFPISAALLVPLESRTGHRCPESVWGC